MHGTERPTCSFCREVIGVYEPIVAVDHASERHTPLAREPHLGHRHGTLLFHPACFLIEQSDSN